MSVNFNATAQSLSQSNNVASSSDYTAMFWIKFNSVPLTDKLIFKRVSGDGLSYSGVFISGTYESVYAEVSDGVTPIPGNMTWIPDIGLGEWKLFSLTYTADDIRTELTITETYASNADLDLSTLTFTSVVLGDNDADFEIAYFREWNSLLTHDEFMEEIQNAIAVKAAITDTPLASTLNDVSGNGNNWSTSPAPAYTTQAPLAVAPANYTEATATVIPSLPYEVTQSDIASQGFVFDVWFKYTAQPGDVLVGEYFYPSSGYNPNQTVYIDDSSKVMKNYGTKRPNQTPLLVGRTYLWKLHSNNHWPTAVLDISLLPGPTEALLPEGSIFIRTAVMDANWLTYGYQGTFAAYINPITQEIYHFIAEFPPGDGGDTLPGGVMLFADEHDVTGVEHRLVLYGPGAVELSHNIWPWYGYYNWPYIRASREFNKFYVCSREGNPDEPGDNSRYTTVEEDGTIGVDEDLPTGYVSAIANSHDDLYVYVAAGNPSVLKKYNKSTHAFDGDIAAAYEHPVSHTPYQIWDLLVMKNGEIVAIYQMNGYPTDIFVRVYDPDGTILHTYNAPSPSKYPEVAARLGYANDDSVSFWLFLHERLLRDEFSRFIQFRLSDMAVLNEFRTPDVYYFLPTFGADPAYRFVTSDCCPIVMAYPAAEPEPPDRSGVYYDNPRAIPGARHDTFYTEGRKIPNPTIRTALLGE